VQLGGEAAAGALRGDVGARVDPGLRDQPLAGDRLVVLGRSASQAACVAYASAPTIVA
jgi:hypothetical protein